MKCVLTWKTVFPIFLVVFAVAIGLWASFLPPAPVVVREGAWAYSNSADPIGHTRLALIIFGLVTPIFTALFAIGYDPRDKRNLLHIALVMACVAACFSFGWRNTPYWANGVYQTYLGRYDCMDMDPKALPPMAWIGEAWRLSVLVFPLLLVLLSGAVFPLVGWAWINERARVRPLLAILIIGCAWLPFFWRVKNYTGWLLD